MKNFKDYLEANWGVIVSFIALCAFSVLGIVYSDTSWGVSFAVGFAAVAVVVAVASYFDYKKKKELQDGENPNILRRPRDYN